MLKSVEPCTRCGKETDNQVVLFWELSEKDVADLRVNPVHQAKHICMECQEKSLKEWEAKAGDPALWLMTCVGCNKKLLRKDAVGVVWETKDGKPLGGGMMCPDCGKIAETFPSLADFIIAMQEKH